MPKLNPEQRKTANAASDDQGFELLPPGRYLGTLKDVEVKPGREYDYWNCKFGDLHDANGKRYPGHQWDRVSMSPKAGFKVKQFFNAMGYSMDSETDEMIGDKCVLVISQKPREDNGEMGNNVERLAPYEQWDGHEEGDDDVEF